MEACRTVFSALGSSFSSRCYTITNGTVISGGFDTTSNTNTNFGTLVLGPIDNFKMGSDYVIGSDCAVVYSTSSGTKAYGYDGKEVDLDDIPDIEKYISSSSSASSSSSSATGTTVIASKGSTINISGYGIGHGVGLSQMGANGMAQNGADYKEILQHYYTGTTVE